MITTAIRQNPPRTSNLARLLMAGALRSITAGYRRRTARRQLESLTLEQLRDVGIDPDVISRAHEIPGDPWTMSRLMSLR